MGLMMRSECDDDDDDCKAVVVGKDGWVYDELDNMSEIGTYPTVVLPPNFQYLLPPDYPAISALFQYFYYIVSVVPVSRNSIKSNHL